MASLAVDGGTLIYWLDETAPDGEPLQPMNHRAARASVAELEQLPGAVALLGYLIRGMNASSSRMSIAVGDNAK